MATTLHFSIPQSMKQFIDEQSAKLGYNTTGEYVRHLVRKEQEAKNDEANLKVRARPEKQRGR